MKSCIFPNLKAEMSRDNISSEDLSELLGIKTRQVSNMLSGKCNISRNAMYSIREKFFQKHKIDYLFSEVADNG